MQFTAILSFVKPRWKNSALCSFLTDSCIIGSWHLPPFTSGQQRNDVASQSFLIVVANFTFWVIFSKCQLISLNKLKMISCLYTNFKMYIIKFNIVLVKPCRNSLFQLCKSVCESFSCCFLLLILIAKIRNVNCLWWSFQACTNKGQPWHWDWRDWTHCSSTYGTQFHVNQVHLLFTLFTSTQRLPDSSRQMPKQFYEAVAQSHISIE